MASLTAAEKEIARKLNFDESVLLLIKKRLRPEMSIVKMGGLEPSDDVLSAANQQYGPAPLLAKDIENYRNIAKTYPELAKLVDSELEHYKPKTMESFTSKQFVEKLKPTEQRQLKLTRAVQEIMPLLRQDAQDKGIPGHTVGFLTIGGVGQRQGFATDAEVDEAIAKLRAGVAGKTLRPENKAKSLLRLQFRGTALTAFTADNRVVQLQTELEPLGYRISEESQGIKTSRQFERKADAEAFLVEAGTRLDGLALTEQKPDSYEAIYPIVDADRQNIESLRIIVHQGTPFISSNDKEYIEKMAQLTLNAPKRSARESAVFQALMPDIRIMPGSVIKKIGDRRWRIDVPARFTATSDIKLATVTKVDKNSIGLELLENNHTSAPNYSISTAMIFEKVKYWNAKYGAQVMDAGRDRFTLKFKSLPDDLSELCTELFMFCPEIELSGDENNNAASMRVMAKRLRNDKTFAFWWD